MSHGCSAGTVPASSTSARGPKPHRQANGMPCRFPLGVMAEVLKSAWAGLAFVAVLAIGVTVVLSLVIGLLIGAGAVRSIVIGFYLGGSFLLVAGFFVGNRGPARVKGGDDTIG